MDRLLFYGARGQSVLDLVPGAAAAYGVRKLRSGYGGALVNIRRSSDNAQMDFSPDSNGNPPTNAISSFIGGGSGFVTKWYDQSGNSNHLGQSTAASQPSLVLNVQNGRPVVRFAGGANGPFLTQLSFNATSFANLTMMMVLADKTQTNSSPRILSFDEPSGQDYVNGLIVAQSTTVWSWDSHDAKSGAFFPAWVFTSGAFHQITRWARSNATTTGGAVADQATPQTINSAAFATAIDSARFALGSSADSFGSSTGMFDMGELIIYPMDLSASVSRAPVEKSQKTYWGTP